jgi:hypothetical protein
MTMLSSPLLLPQGIVRSKQLDAERFAASVLHRELRRRQATLREHDFEDALSFLLAQLWRLSERFDSSRGLDFDGYAGKWLPPSFTDWYRARFVDKRYEYGDPERRDAIAFAGSLDGIGMGIVVPIHSGSDEADSDEARGRLERERDRFRARDIATIRSGLTRQGEARTQSEGVAA